MPHVRVPRVLQADEHPVVGSQGREVESGMRDFIRLLEYDDVGSVLERRRGDALWVRWAPLGGRVQTFPPVPSTIEIEGKTDWTCL